MSESNRVVLAYVPETVYNQTPVDSADWQKVRLTSESLTASPRVETSEEIRDDRMISDQFILGRDVNGSISGEFSADSYDDFMEAALAGTWNAGELKASTDKHSFTLQREYGDLTNRFRAYAGMRVDTMSINWAFGEKVSIEFGFAGATTTTPLASLVGAGTLNPATTTNVMTATAIGNITIDGAPSTVCIKSFSLNTANNLEAIECVGSSIDPTNQRYGSISVSGNIEMYLQESVFGWIAKKDNQTSVSLSFDMTKNGVTYNVLIPNLKISGDDPNAEALNSDTMLNADFTGLYDATAGTSIVITKV